jgi:SanA protein
MNKETARRHIQSDTAKLTRPKRGGGVGGNKGGGFRHLLRQTLALGLALAILGILFVISTDAFVASTGRGRVVAYDQLAALAGEAGFDCIIVPGALVYPDGHPSEMLADRLDMAIRLFNDGLAPRILVSGDHGRPEYNEVASMRNYLMAAGIPESCIFMDHAGFDTFDTVYRAKAVFQVRRAIFTTQDFQLLRALYIGSRLGVDLWGVDAQYSASYYRIWYRIREYLARTKAFLDCEIWHATPTFTGPSIPISGDGRVTADGS